MEHRFNQWAFIRRMIAFSPRQLAGEAKARALIESVLRLHRTPFTRHEFRTEIPKTRRAVLIADGRQIPCQNTGFIGGRIHGKSYLVSSMIPSRFLIAHPNINFNPLCPETISCSNHYFAPSLAVPRSEIVRLLRAKHVEGETSVKRVPHRTANILVGNRKNPQTICFAHYDSINRGAIDNASGVAVMMTTLIRQPELLKTTLFVFSANEELSYDRPTYWGRGFREFERKFFRQMSLTKKIIAIDSLGYGRTLVSQHPNLQYLAFPITNIKQWREKIYVVCGEFEKLMAVYHSDADDMRGMDRRYLEDGVRRLMRLMG